MNYNIKHVFDIYNIYIINYNNIILNLLYKQCLILHFISNNKNDYISR